MTTPTTGRAAQRAQTAFTLIEVLVALALGAIVLAVCVGFFANTLHAGARSRARAELAREGAFVAQLLDRELRQAGVGVPRGAHIDGGYGTAPRPVRFPAAVLVATATQVGIAADVPRPDATYNTFGTLDSATPGGDAARHLPGWHTENNGGCMPADGEDCTGATSLFFPGEDGCNDTGDEDDRTCPWGMKRARAADRLQVVDGAGGWSHTALRSPLDVHDHGGPLEMRLAVDFDAPWDAAATHPSRVPGLGYVTSLDRVFFRLNNGDLERIQCWGDPDPNDPDWPDATATAIPANPAAVSPAGAGNVCTAPEPIAHFVESLSLRYFDADDVELAGAIDTAAEKAAIRRIAFRVRLSRAVNNELVTHDAVGGVRLRNPAP